MNIANIFGLHLGCRIKHSFTHDNTLREGISLLTGVQVLQGGTILLEAGFKEYNYQFCKLILKPLSKITDEDKKQMQEFFWNEYGIIERLYLDCDKVVFVETVSAEKFALNPNELLWLCSKGYDIGIVPDEYKEVEK